MDGEWRVIAEFPKYSVSSTGSVRNNVTGRILKAGKNSIGYLYVDLYSEDNHKSVAVHRLVAEAFIENPENKNCIDHIDTNKENNNVGNLRWVTYKENTNNPSTLEAVRARAGKSPKAVQQYMGDRLVAEYDSISDAARKLGLKVNYISRCCLGKRKTYKGYNWRFKL